MGLLRCFKQSVVAMSKLQSYHNWQQGYNLDRLVEVVGDGEQRNNNVERYPQSCGVTKKYDVQLDRVLNLARIRDLGSILRRDS